MAKKKKNIKNITPDIPEMPVEPVEEAETPAEQFPMDENEMRSDIERSFEDVKTKNNALESQQIAVSNQIRQLKLEILKELFDFLQKNGVDPNDLASISQFLQKLEQKDPDFVALFELVLNGLSPEGQTESVGAGESVPRGEMAGNMEGMAPPVAQGASVTSTPSVAPITSAAPPKTPPAFMERYNNLKQRGIIQ